MESYSQAAPSVLELMDSLPVDLPQLFNTCCEISPAGFGMVNPQTGQIVFANPAFQQSFAGILEDVRGKTLPQLGLVQTCPLGQLFYAGNPSWQWRNVSAQFSPLPELTIHTVISAEPFEADGQQFVLLFLVDVTGEKSSKAALFKNQQHFSQIVNNAPGMLYQFVLHRDGTYSMPFVSRGCVDIYGLQPEVIQRDPQQIFDLVVDQIYFHQSIQRSAEAMTPWDETLRCRFTDGSTRWLRGVSKPEQQSNGDILWNGYLMDVTAQRITQDERDAFFMDSVDMLCIAGFDGYFKQINPAFEKTLGYTLEELKAKPFMAFVHPEDREKTIAEFDKILNGAVTLNFENRYLKANGEYVWILWNSRPSTEHGLIYAVARDFTAYKQLEKEKQTFIATLSHDLKTPLTAEKQVLQLLLDQDLGTLSEEQAHILKELLHSNRFMFGMVENLLATIRYQIYEVKLNRKRETLNRFIEKWMDGDIRHMGVGQRLAFEPDAGVDAVWIDPVEMRRVLNNLLHNAFQHTVSTDSITVTTRKVQSGTEIIVSDTGSGISPAQMETLFEPFATHQYRFKQVGTGLGLYLCKKIVEAHGGAISVSSMPGEGAAFTLFLPELPDGVPKTGNK